MRELLHYEILQPLGEGAMGQVFRARDTKLGREVALKLLPHDIAAEQTSQARLVREARAASALNHPGIVTLHDIESVDGQSFIVMELVEGERFGDLAKRGIPWRRAVTLVASVADAMAYAHARDILHRDIKADNLMVTPSGQTKVLDFGLAKLRQANAEAEASVRPPAKVSDELAIAKTVRSSPPPTASDLTQAGQIVGTPAYMAPECYEGHADARSEVFALGIVLYELLAGKRPFDRETTTGTMVAIQIEDPAPPSRAAPGREIPERVDAIVLRALAKQPAERFADMTAFAVALRELVAVRARRWPWIAAALAAVLAATAVTYVVIRRDRPIEIAVRDSRRLTFDPGCEEYPRLHPDRQRVVYDGYVDGDYEIQIRDLDGTHHRRLTTSPGWDYAAAISPDGMQVAYVHEHPFGRTLRVVSIDGGEPRDLGATVGYPAWSSDGALLVGDPNGQIVKRTLAGTTTVLGRLPAGARLYHLVEVPGGGVALLWWTSSEADATALGELATDGTLRVIAENAVDYEGGLAASRRHRGYYATKKAVVEGNQLLFRPWGGGSPTVVTGGLSPGAGIDVAPDGKRLVFSTCVERQYIARVTGGQPQVLSRGTWQDTAPHVIDARRTVITSDRSGTMQGWLLGDGEPRAVTPPGALGTTASPDGKRVVFVTRTGLAIADLGGAPTALTTDPSDTSPSFTRDGSEVVFERTGAHGETEIRRVPIAAGADRAVAPGAQPSASPVDDAIVFLGPADGSGARRVMLADAHGTRVLANLPPAEWLRPRFSIDGTRLVLVRGYQQIVTAPLDGAPTVEYTATTGGVNVADFAPDGSIIAALGDYDGDLWLAEGTFP